VNKYFLLIAALFIHLQLMGQNQAVVVSRSETISIVNGNTYYSHRVEQGQTMFSIARVYGVSQQEILKHNPEVKSGLKTGQVILIPARDVQLQTEVPFTTDFEKHQVRRQETLYGISRRYGVSVDDILQHNPEAIHGIRPRQVLRIPVKRQLQTSVYQVQAGETLYSISRRFGSSVDDIVNLNPGLTSDIRPGQFIYVPVSEIIPANEQADSQQQGILFISEQDTQEEEVQENSICLYPELKEKYNVALFIPLYLEELDTITDYFEMSPNHKSFTFLEYYKGILVAMDSIVNARGVEIVLHVFDVDQNLSKAILAINDPRFREMDLVIGPFFPQTLAHVSEYGRRYNIPVVSPLLDDRRLLEGNTNIFQVTPSNQSQLAVMAEYISYTYAEQNLILVHNSQRQAEELINGFKNELEKGIRASLFYIDSLNLARVNGFFVNGSLVGDRRTNVMVINDSIFEVRSPDTDPTEYFRQNPLKEVIFARQGIDGVLEALEKNRKNIIITLIGGEAFVADYLRQLNHHVLDEYDVAVFGTHHWMNYSNVEIDYLQNLQVHMYSDDFRDYDDAHIRNFVRRYRSVFQSEPGNYAFKGVRTGWFFFNALTQYGSNFHQCIRMMNSSDFENPFYFYRANENRGWENKTTTLFKYENFRMVDVRKPVKVSEIH
jgi:LysM repeat protein